MENIHILPTDKPSRLIIYSTLLNEFRLLDEPYDDWKHKRNIYITSDEEIKDGDWFLTDDKRVEKCAPDWRAREWHKKIILTTDQDLIKDGVQAIDDEFLEWFVKNPSCEFVDVNDWMDTNGNIAFGGNIRYQISFSTYKEIIIPKEEPKQETIEEAAKTYRKTIPNSTYGDELGFIDGAKWQAEQNKNKYSEEEMVNFAEFVATYADKNRNVNGEMLHAKSKYDGAERTIDLLEKWFEQYKNK